jgi:hypothetical protein
MGVLWRCWGAMWAVAGGARARVVCAMGGTLHVVSRSSWSSTSRGFLIVPAAD